MKDWFTWANAKKAYLALGGAIVAIAAVYADVTWLASAASVATTIAVWLAKNEPSTNGS